MAATYLGVIMLHYAVVFFLIAIVAAVFGFGGIAVGQLKSPRSCS